MNQTMQQVRPWQCVCSEPPVVLGVLRDDDLELTIGERLFLATGGRIVTVCPSCGSHHIMDMTRPVVAR